MVLAVFSVDFGGRSDLVARIYVLPLSSMSVVGCQLHYQYYTFLYEICSNRISDLPLIFRSSSALVSSTPHTHRNARPLLAL